MAVQLLFKCWEKAERTDSYGANAKKFGGVKLSPTSPIEGHPLYEEMKAFFQFTPGGLIDFTTINEAALAQFEPGKLYRITIEAAE